MPVYNTPNFCKVVLRTMPSVHHSHQRFPDADEVKSGVVYGPGQFEQQEYLTGTYVGGGGSGLSARVIGSAVVRRISL